MDLLNRFLKYVSIDTTSDSKSTNTPSTESQKEFAKYLVNELLSLGIETIYDSKNCYIYAYLPGEIKEKAIGFISHMDTSEASAGKDIKPNIITKYNGQEIKLKNGVVISPKEEKSLAKKLGKTIITTDGTTLLGADDKAGIAEIMTMAEYFTKNTNRCSIYLCFTPDEEIGKGTAHFKKTNFLVDFAYTIDGSGLGEISYENFNAATATIEINGINCHPGQAKEKIINSLHLATALNESLPKNFPENTEQKEGFFHLQEITGDVSHTKMKYIIRDFDKEEFENKKEIMKKIIDQLNEKYNDSIDLTIVDTYYNMKDKLKDNMTAVEIVKKAMKNLGIEEKIEYTRGGTDGASLAYDEGIICPNIGTGSYNFHSVKEYSILEEMEKTANTLIEIVNIYSSKEESKVIIKK